VRRLPISNKSYAWIMRACVPPIYRVYLTCETPMARAASTASAVDAMPEAWLCCGCHRPAAALGPPTQAPRRMRA
jgi:hypothetical protein